MKILLISENYHPITGGTETLVRKLAHELRSNGYQVKVAAFRFTPLCYSLPSRLKNYAPTKYIYTSSYPDHKDLDVPVCSLSPNWFDRFRLLPMLLSALPGNRLIATCARNLFGISQYDWAIFCAVYLPKLRKIMKSFDAVHFFGGDFLGWATQRAAKQAGIPFIVTPLMHPLAWGDDPINVAYYKNSDAVIAQHEAEYKTYLSLEISPQKLYTIGTPPDLPAHSDSISFRKKFALENFPIVLFIGRLVAYKGAKSILDAAREIWQNFPDTRFIFIGPLSEESELWFKNVDSRVLYLGTVDQQEKADALAACDIFCMPSIVESLGMVYLEAWSHKKPVIGGKAIYSPTLIEGNHAGLVVDQSAEAVSAAIQKLLKSPKLRYQYGEAGYTLVQTKFNLQAICNDLEKLYRNLAESQDVSRNLI